MQTKEIKLYNGNDLKLPENENLKKRILKKYHDLFYDSEVNFLIDDFISEKKQELENLGYFDVEIHYNIGFGQGDYCHIDAKIEFFDYCKTQNNLQKYCQYKDKIDIDYIYIKDNYIPVNSFERFDINDFKVNNKVKQLFDYDNLEYIEKDCLNTLENLGKKYYRELSDIILDLYNENNILEYIINNNIHFDEKLSIYYED